MVQTETETIMYVVQPGGVCEIQRTFLERRIDSMPPHFFQTLLLEKDYWKVKYKPRQMIITKINHCSLQVPGWKSMVALHTSEELSSKTL